jgi:CRISPR/Cas system-associated exonuclease Cas4 (RecB family)
MKMPPAFQFSQSSLQDFIDCPRRFELRYILGVKWPAPITEPVIEFEHHIQQGVAFHQMVQQYLSGVPIEKIMASSQDADLFDWWQNFSASAPTQKYSGQIFPEYRLSIPFSGYRLVAQYDLLIMETSGRTVIFDWKTSRVHPRKNSVAKKVQTRLYPFLLVESGLRANRITPEQIILIYWYPNFPSQPDEIIYTPHQYQLDKEFIQKTVKAILDTPSGSFELTPNLKACSFCNYRSLCSRGEKAGDIADMEDEDNANPDSPIDLDFNSLSEIQF